MKVTKEYLEERHVYWVKRIGDTGIWDATLFKPVSVEPRKRSKVYNGHFVRRWVKVFSTIKELRDIIILYLQYPGISDKYVNSTLV